MDYLIRFLPSGREARIGEDHSILDAAKKANVFITSPCNGRGACEKCGVKVSEGKVVGEKSGGSYLACRTYPLTDLVVEVPEESLRQVYSVSERIELSEVTGLDVSLAIDLGTSSVSGYLVDSKTGHVVGHASVDNKQTGYGLDVLSRIEYSDHHGVESLNRRIIASVNELIDELIGEREHLRVGDVVCAGNPAMTFFLLDKDPDPILQDPDSEIFRRSYSEPAERLRLNASGNLYTLPGVSSFVGGDVLADILSSGIYDDEEPAMIVDIGTNGEIVLGGKEFLVACSASAGPAFEGGEIRSGMRASMGAIDHVRLKNGSLAYSTLGDDLPAGICGSGLIDLVACLFSTGVVDYQGRFTRDAADVLSEGSHGREYVLVSGEDSFSGKDIGLSEQEIHSFIRSKAALYAGMRSLLKVGVSLEDLSRVYVAGSFGLYLDVENAVSIGLLPDIEREKFKFIGNGSLKGAYLALTDPEKKAFVSELASQVTYVDLSRDEAFNDEYLAALYLPHQDENLFPSKIR